MEPYVVRQNDYLLKIAHKLGFDPDAVWNDPSNGDLSQLRSDHSILFAGDLLQVPSPADAPVHPLTVGSTNSFVAADAPATSISVKLVNDDDDQKYAGRAYTITELADLTGLTSGGDGVLTFQVPVTLDAATIVFADNGESLVLQIGGMDPIDTMSGVFKRLQNLGFIDWSVEFDTTSSETNLGVVREALRWLKGSQGSNAGGGPGVASRPRICDSDDDEAPPAGGDGAASQAGESSDDASAGDSGASDANGDDDDAGIDGDGKLSTEMKTMLTSAHGY